ncbi:hypothetical protein [Marinactinospora rubrisoli]|uniref:Uncharacterized protein n=1 Tax=Marinactinospora rubrisoli TaxID=2715399 RepID=A0ABW2KG24_9ACTN
MGVSLYYTITRDTPLSPTERERVDALTERYSGGLVDRVDGEFPGKAAELVREYCEPFGWYSADTLEPGEVLAGSVKVSHTQAPWELMLLQVEHWLQLLSEVRAALPTTGWRVHVDGTAAEWDAEAGRFRLT